MQDNTQYYGLISRVLHWSMAACFAFMLFTASVESFGGDFGEWIPVHKSVGTILLALIVLRIVWAFSQASKRSKADNIAVKLGHLALYVLMFAVPFTAMLRQYGGARGSLKVFGVEVMQGSPEKIDALVNIGNAAHGNLGWILFALAAGHIAMAIVHQIKGEKIINRMAGR
ncbi:MAG: cytochrome b [Neisseria sp.]|nr:cytochrome b [Neisseria sp.]